MSTSRIKNGYLHFGRKIKKKINKEKNNRKTKGWNSHF